MLAALVLIAGCGTSTSTQTPTQGELACQPFPLPDAQSYLTNEDTGGVRVAGAKAKKAAAVPFRAPVRGKKYWAIAIDATTGTPVVYFPGATPEGAPQGLTFSADAASEAFVAFPPAGDTKLGPEMVDAGSEAATVAAKSCLG